MIDPIEHEDDSHDIDTRISAVQELQPKQLQKINLNRPKEEKSPMKGPMLGMPKPGDVIVEVSEATSGEASSKRIEED